MTLILESEVIKVLRNNLEKDDYDRVFKKVRELKQIEAIPIHYIGVYADSHDADCKIALTNLVDNYRRLHSGGDNGERVSQLP